MFDSQRLKKMDAGSLGVVIVRAWSVLDLAVNGNGTFLISKMLLTIDLLLMRQGWLPAT